MMNEPRQEDIEKRIKSFRALREQDGDIDSFIESVAEAYEWMRADRDYWRKSYLRSESVERK